MSIKKSHPIIPFIGLTFLIIIFFYIMHEERVYDMFPDFFNIKILIGVIVLTFVLRWLGAWMLRINDVITALNEVKLELKRLNSK